MSLTEALRTTEFLIGWALLLQSWEHLQLKDAPRALFLSRLVLSLLMLGGVDGFFPAALLFLSGGYLLVLFRGPYNGGSDRMTLLVLTCFTLAKATENPELQKLALGYLAVQLCLSYFMAGVTKAANPEWWNGKALHKIRTRLHYLSQDSSLRSRHLAPGLEKMISWSIVATECAFPFILVNPQLTRAGLGIAFLFHLTNAALLGLNRFTWAWLAAYPAVLWLQSQIKF